MYQPGRQWFPRILMLLCTAAFLNGVAPSVARAQTPGLRGFAHVTFGVRLPAQRRYEQDATSPIFHLPEANIYHLKPALITSGTVGVMFSPLFGASVGLSGLSKSQPADIVFSSIAGQIRGTSTSSRAFQHKETNLHIDACLAPRVEGNVEGMLFVGLTHFAVTQELIHDYSVFVGPLSTLLVTPESVTGRPSAHGGWGFNAGLSITKSVAGRIGVGGMLRYSRGRVQFPNVAAERQQPGSTVTAPMTVGGLEAGASVTFAIK